MAEKLSVKVYYIENKATKEVRKFSVGEDVVSNYVYLIGKIRQIFPDLLRKDLKLFWKDDENDYISVSTDEELMQALTAIPTGSECLKLFVKVKGTDQSGKSQEHPGVVCDGCDSKISGIRFKCTSCYDYDLCSSCEKKSTHPESHEMLCIKTPRSGPGVHVFRSPHYRCAYRGEAPWFANRRSHCRRNEGCPSKKPGCSKETTKEQTPEQCHKEEWKQWISQLSASFGLDPEVAVSSMDAFFQNIGTEQEKSDYKQEEGKQHFDFNEMMKQMAPVFQIDPEILLSTARSFAANCEQPQQKPEEEKDTEQHASGSDTTPVNKSGEEHDSNPEKKMETESNKSNECSSNQQGVDFNKMVNGFAKQFGFPSDSQQQEGPNLGNVMQHLFQSLSTSANNSELNKESETSKSSPENSDEFVVVDKKVEDESLSDEEKFERRLEKALRQMETMGFDNDGGWLRQLLISKELSIGRVLDALNPAV